MSKDTSFRRLIYAALAVPSLTALVYVISFGYQYGKLGTFGLAEEFISFSPTQLLIAVKILGLYLIFLLAATVLIAENFNLKLKKNPVDQDKLVFQVLLMNALALAIAKTLSSDTSLILKSLILVAILTSYLTLLNLANRLATKTERRRQKKTSVFGIRYGDSDLGDLVNRFKSVEVPALLLVSAVMAGLVSQLAGTITAQFNKSYYQVPGKPNFVVVTKSDNKLLLAGFDTKTYKLNGRYLILPMEDNIEITINRYIPLELPNENGKVKF